ncbi:MAG: serine--tRNA ligase, partial [Bdellovibrionota bacterium]
MLDPQYFNEKVDELESALHRRHQDAGFVAKLVDLSKSRRHAILEVETLKAKRNQASQEIAQLKAKAKSDPAAAALADKRVVEMREVGDRVKALDENLKSVQEQLAALELRIPNMPDRSVPDGADAAANRVVRSWGEPT